MIWGTVGLVCVGMHRVFLHAWDQFPILMFFFSSFFVFLFSFVLLFFFFFACCFRPFLRVTWGWNARPLYPRLRSASYPHVFSIFLFCLLYFLQFLLLLVFSFFSCSFLQFLFSTCFPCDWLWCAMQISVDREGVVTDARFAAKRLVLGSGGAPLRTRAGRLLMQDCTCDTLRSLGWARRRRLLFPVGPSIGRSSLSVSAGVSCRQCFLLGQPPCWEVCSGGDACSPPCWWTGVSSMCRVYLATPRSCSFVRHWCR